MRHLKHLTLKIQGALSEDLLKPEFRGQAHKLAGHCYVASEALYHLTEKKLRPFFIRHEGAPHWFLKDESNKVYDLTAEQFSTPVPYHEAKGKGFLTKEPSARTRVVVDRVKSNRPANKRSVGESR